MRIAFVTPKMVFGGAESYVIVKSRYLVERGYKIIVISAGGENVVNLPDNVHHFILNNIDKAPYELSCCKRQELMVDLERILLDNQIDLVEAHNTYPIYYGALVARKIGIACLYNLLNELSHRKQRITNVLVQEFSKAGCYFTLTEQMNGFVMSAVGCKLMPVIIPIPVERTDASTNCCEDRNYILTVCRFSRDKLYVLSLIEGFAEAIVLGKVPNGFVLKVVGDGELRGEIESCALKANMKVGRNVVELLGFRNGEELERLYCNCTLYVGMGTTMLKAAQLGKTVICVGLEPPLSHYAWGCWGENPEQDVHSLAEQNNEISNGTTFAEALSIVSDKDRLRVLGMKAKILFNSYFELNSIMQEWEQQYERVFRDGTVVMCNPLKIRVFFLRSAWCIFQLIKRLR